MLRKPAPLAGLTAWLIEEDDEATELDEAAAMAWLDAKAAGEALTAGSRSAVRT